jgi:heterodisulfide reductase subunit C
MNTAIVKEAHTCSSHEPNALERIQKMVRACIQCGTCSGSCPNEFAMDFTPRRLWRMVLAGQADEIFSSKTFLLCSACYFCTLRCPRGLPLTEAMDGLKQMAAETNSRKQSGSIQFYRKFIQSVRRHGRVHELEFMTYYFAALKNPWIMLRFAPLGIKLIRKGKISLRFPVRHRHPLESIFHKVELLEKGL